MNRNETNLLGLVGRLLLLVFASLLLGESASAQGDATPPEMSAPARLGLVEGPAQFWRSGGEGWAPAQLNTALAAGDTIHAGDGGTVEIQVGARDFVRMTANTTVTLVAHDAGLMQFRVGQGTASFDLRTLDARRLVEIDTPNASFIVGGAGYYRLDVQADNLTRLTLRHGGRATMSLTDGRSRNVFSAEQLLVLGGSRPSVESHAAPPQDPWDRWNDDRSSYYASATSSRYVPADAYGAADLDRHGNWRQMEPYGWVWMPEVASGWAPYSMGSWQWDPFYGWTWVDQAPWGWTTSHYGRWVFLDGYWVWAPGPRTGRAIYAPALVNFTRLGSGGMSWVALGWGEPLIPWWGQPGFRGNPWWGGWAGPRLGIDIETHRHRNWNAPNAVVSVPGDNLGYYRPFGPQPSRPEAIIDPRPRHGDPTRPQSSVGVIPRAAGPLPPQAQPAPPAQAPVAAPAAAPPSPTTGAIVQPPRVPPPVTQPQTGPAPVPAVGAVVQPQRTPPPAIQPQAAPFSAPVGGVVLQPQRTPPPVMQPQPAPTPGVRIEPTPRMGARPEFRSEPRIEAAPGVAPPVVRPPSGAAQQGGESRIPRERGPGRERRNEGAQR